MSVLIFPSSPAFAVWPALSGKCLAAAAALVAAITVHFAPFPLSRLPRLTAWDVPFNPVRPLPPVGGLPRLHGIEPEEVDVSLPLGERVGHSLVLASRAWARRGSPNCS